MRRLARDTGRASASLLPAEPRRRPSTKASGTTRGSGTTRTVDEFVGVEKNDPENDGERYDGHVPRGEGLAPSGQFSVASARPSASGGVTGPGVPRNELPVTAASPALPFLPAVHAQRP